ncbi:hypothetical protein [Streptomyces tsukubensis]|uniref:Translation initiation factor IF-2 n=1 Tax=Streptomyces tsukubensis (strain DSM 42081 / NBRC 108919 / NRRL 18488 / 9993) TaxID=1114943 RepID=A0A7G3UDA1_STRT9|nr:hypothetical protein [Streptomyces tsukubensis]QKM67968.1 hypothetical protein STSU_013095 [Streptomyces tsukubensis NRRL18488]TAI44366.1 hypothetical protein EWI31_12895 [Streptomyces tsukubensis]
MRPGTAAQLAAVLAAGALLGCSGCASPAVDPIERLGRRAVHSGETPAASPAPGPRARFGPEPAAVRSGAPAPDPAGRPGPGPQSAGVRGGPPGPVGGRTGAPDAPVGPGAVRSRAPLRTPASGTPAAPAIHAPALAEPAGRLLDRLHGTRRPAPRPGGALQAPRDR